MASVAKVFKFTIAELFVLLEAWFVFLKWDLLISFTQYKHWRSELNSLNDLSDLNDSANKSVNKSTNQPTSKIKLCSLEQIKKIIKLSEIAGRFHIRKMNCLRRCIAQEKMLLKRGYKTRMHIGVRFDEEKLKAHAWLTLQGKVINDTDDVSTRYSELKANNEQIILNSLK